MAVATIASKEAEAAAKAEAREVANRPPLTHADTAKLAVPTDLPPGTKATLIGPDETPVIEGTGRKMLDRPIIYRNIQHPNLKILGKEIIRPSEDDPTRRVRYRLPMIKFHETYLKVEYEDEKEIVERCIPATQLFIEPHEEDGGRLMEYRDEHGRIIFATRNPDVYMAFERKMRT